MSATKASNGVRRYSFVLTGDMPLLMKADNIEAADELDAWRKAPENKNLSKPGDDRSPAWTWQSCLYDDGEHIAMPFENIFVALRQAGAQIILKKQKTFKEITQSGITPGGTCFEFSVNGKQIPISAIHNLREMSYPEQVKAVEKFGFSLFMKRAKVGQSKHIRVRPRFSDWQVSGTVNVIVPEITTEILDKLFELAGKVGLCDWRPGCKTPGPYGMFKHELSAI